MTAPQCRKPRPAIDTCVAALADGWIVPADLCPACTRAFMDALDKLGGPLVWHPNFAARAER